MTKFWDKLSEGMAQKWATNNIGFALAFWMGGLLSLVYDNGWKPVEKWVSTFHNQPMHIALVFGGLMIVAASAALVEWLQLSVIRLAEGYWPWPFRKIRFNLAKRREKRVADKDKRWNELEPLVQSGTATPEQKDEFARIDVELSRYPQDSAGLMPTTLGNLLRSAEEYPRIRYGLVINVCWPLLWMIMPKETRETVAEARQRLNSAARMMVWGIFFLVWTIWAWWVPIPALAVAAVGYIRMINAAGPYGDLLRAAFDLHRFSLYEFLRWPLPSDSAEETVLGEELTEYLFRGDIKRTIQFVHKNDISAKLD